MAICWAVKEISWGGAGAQICPDSNTKVYLSNFNGLRPLLHLLSGAAGLANPWLPTNLSNSHAKGVPAALATLVHRGFLGANPVTVMCKMLLWGKFSKKLQQRGPEQPPPWGQTIRNYWKTTVMGLLGNCYIETSVRFGLLGDSWEDSSQGAWCLMLVVASLLSTEAILTLMLLSHHSEKAHGETIQERAVSLREERK